VRARGAARFAFAAALVTSACCDCGNPAQPVVTPTPTAAPTVAPTATPRPVATNSPPELGLDVGPKNGPAPLSVLANMCFCSDADQDDLFYEFHWGDGKEGGSTFCRRTHVYGSPGTYQAYFCVTDRKSDTVCKGYRITVS
jgi:hypothetical protein